MKLHISLLLVSLACVWSVNSHGYGMEYALKEMKVQYASWPSLLNGFRRRREVNTGVGMSEGGGVIIPATSSSVKEPVKPAPQEPEKTKDELEKVPFNTTVNASNVTATNATPEGHNEIESGKNMTIIAKQLDLNDPGVLTRGVIVFGSFTLLAVAYYVFYKKKGKNNDNTSTHNANDATPFRYGVLHSDDQRDTLELSRVPLTMESDDDDEEDMEIFDIGQKKKSLVYVDLKGNDEDIVFQKSTESKDDNNLLLDLEDASTDPILNWNNSNANKSLL